MPGEPPAAPAGPAPQATVFVRFAATAIVSVYLVTTGALALIGLLTGQRNTTFWGLPANRWWALTFGVGTVGAGLLILHLIGQRPSKLGLFRSIVGADLRFPTSLTQLGLWTVAAGTGFGFLLGRAMFEDVRFSTVLPGATWDDYLILLGGPFAGAVLAKGIITYKLSNGTLQKSEPATTTPAQVLTNDKGAADLVDAQYLLFNLIALGYFVVELSTTSVLPAIPGPLLAMTSATAGLFVANKAAQRNAPAITSVSPLTAEPGDEVTILGANFDPVERDDPRRRITVSLTGSNTTIYSKQTSDTRVLFTVPADAEQGDQTVAVTSTAGAQTEAHNIRIRSKRMMVTGSENGSLRPNSGAVIVGRNLGRPADTITVFIGTMPLVATADDTGTRLSFDVPDTLPDVAADVVNLKI